MSEDVAAVTLLVKDKAAKDAEEVRAAYSDPGFPVDPEQVARAMGMVVEPTMLVTDISGMLQVNPGVPPRIYVDYSDVPQRQRFTVAHEIGHYYEHTSRGQDDFNFIDKRGGPYDVHEAYADEFAGNLLMPAPEVDQLHRRGAGLATMARHFDVSLSAMQVRLKRLGLRA
ncbi:MAG: ImmA/IrrE family metallo-endopeptidase [Micrococcales bacterium]|nr:ImmA/IrrE family metallo-endopeptidase [Micrococcales bacterium]